ncbi:hypothetical protein Daus18300_001924 [Diaporthe australafricana]|uniref:RING-type E3 ubiquitin transferase n=1 Tax=Diaporthe australafricana TaxID=127596 RepID=A0ABR3XRP7_9PEZI
MAAASRRPLPPVPPQVAEEDECPVCHRELPPRELANYEALRQAHINMCISSHSAYGTPGSDGPSMAPRRTGMFPYVATEKDCVDSAECTICLEEFEISKGKCERSGILAVGRARCGSRALRLALTGTKGEEA